MASSTPLAESRLPPTTDLIGSGVRPSHRVEVGGSLP